LRGIGALGVPPVSSGAAGPRRAATGLNSPGREAHARPSTQGRLCLRVGGGRCNLTFVLWSRAAARPERVAAARPGPALPRRLVHVVLARSNATTVLLQARLGACSSACPPWEPPLGRVRKRHPRMVYLCLTHSSHKRETG